MTLEFRNKFYSPTFLKVLLDLLLKLRSGLESEVSERPIRKCARVFADRSLGSDERGVIGLEISIDCQFCEGK